MRLYLIRHGKAEKDAPTGRDADRPLKPRGIRQATWLGETIAGMKKKPMVVLSSPAARTLDTARIIAHTLGVSMEVVEKLSTAFDLGAMLSVIVSQRQKTGGKTLAIVGHNPTLEMAATAICAGHSGGLVLRTGEALVIDLKEPEPTDGPTPRGELVKRLRVDDEDD